MAKKLNTELFSTGAEFLVLAKLLLSNIQTYKSYVNFEGYDLVCVNPEKGLSAKIQVKSKNFKGDSSFYLNSEDKSKADFYVFAQTNAIKRDKDKYLLISDEAMGSKLFVMDLATVEKHKSIDKKGNRYIKISTKNIPNIEDYINNWNSIKEFLKIKLGEI